MEQATFKSLPNTSATKINKNGDNGSPCLILRDGMKVPNGNPLIRIEKRHVEMIGITQEIQF